MRWNEEEQSEVHEKISHSSTAPLGYRRSRRNMGKGQPSRSETGVQELERGVRRVLLSITGSDQETWQRMKRNKLLKV